MKKTVRRCSPVTKILSLLTACACLLGLFAGCDLVSYEPAETTAAESGGGLSTDDETASASASETAVSDEGDRVLGLSWDETAGLNPYTSTNISNVPIYSLLYDSLFLVDSDYNVSPSICKSYSVSDDMTIWRFEIYDNIKFSDGTPLTAKDVVASLNAADDSDTYHVRFRFTYAFIETGDYTFSASLGRSCENFAVLLDVPIMKESTLQDEEPIGSGPYCKSGNTLVRNPYWWQDGSPNVDVDRVDLISVSGSESVRDEFEFGDVDVVYTDPYALYNAQFQGDNEPWAIYTTEMQYIGFNQNSTYCSNSTLRAAITYIINREDIITSIYNGYGQAAVLPCSPQSSLYDSALAAEYSYDEEKFIELFKSSGISADPANPLQIVISNTNTHRSQAANYIAEVLTSYGLYATVVTADHLNFLYLLRNGEFDMYISEIRLPPNFDLYCFFADGYYACVGGLNSETSRELMNQAIENSGNYYELYRTILSRGLLCPIMFKVNVLYTTRGTLGRNAPGISNFLQNKPTASMEDIKTEFLEQ